jgi:phage terminase large subunit-like protein
LNKVEQQQLQKVLFSDSPDGFELYYTMSRFLGMPRHVRSWVDKIFDARNHGRGSVIYSFRGSAKTESITQALTSYEIAMHPERTNLLFQVGDGSAVDNTSKIVNYIANNAFWKSTFPHIVPDKATGWSQSGYNVWDKRVPYDVWQVRHSKDPTLLGLSYKSSDAIGKRPSMMLITDDINNEQNTRSWKESDLVNRIVQGTILPTMTHETWPIFVGTPWTRRDVLSYVAGTGEFEVIETPGFYTAKESDEGAVWFEEMEQWIRPTWPEVFNVEQLRRRLKMFGTTEFARMILLDLKQAEGKELKREWLHTMSASEIHQDWPVYIGVDYGSSIDRQKSNEDLDYCTIAWGRGIPGGGVVLEGGWRDRVSQGEAEMKLKSVCASFGPRVQIVTIENVSAGKEFYALMLRSSSLPVMEGQPGNRSKGERFQKKMAPLFEFSRVWVSDSSDPFLSEFTAEWVGYPFAPHDDTLDAVFWMLNGAVGNLMTPDVEGLPDYGSEFEDETPFSGLRDHHG